MGNKIKILNKLGLGKNIKLYEALYTPAEVEYEAELLDSALGISRALSSPLPNFKFEA